jgi:hypothetical protein
MADAPTGSVHFDRQFPTSACHRQSAAPAAAATRPADPAQAVNTLCRSPAGWRAKGFLIAGSPGGPLDHRRRPACGPSGCISTASGTAVRAGTPPALPDAALCASLGCTHAGYRVAVAVGANDWVPIGDAVRDALGDNVDVADVRGVSDGVGEVARGVPVLVGAGTRICWPTGTLFGSIPGFAAKRSESATPLVTAIADNVSPGTIVCTVAVGVGLAVLCAVAGTVGNARICVAVDVTITPSPELPPPQATVRTNADASNKALIRIGPLRFQSLSSVATGGAGHRRSTPNPRKRTFQAETGNCYNAPAMLPNPVSPPCRSSGPDATLMIDRDSKS